MRRETRSTASQSQTLRFLRPTYVPISSSSRASQRFCWAFSDRAGTSSGAGVRAFFYAFGNRHPRDTGDAGNAALRVAFEQQRVHLGEQRRFAPRRRLKIALAQTRFALVFGLPSAAPVTLNLVAATVGAEMLGKNHRQSYSSHGYRPPPKFYLTFSLFSLLYPALAQVTTRDIDLNNVRGAVYANGTLWSMLGAARLGLEVPKVTPGQPRRKTVYGANLWIGGFDTRNRVCVAAETYRQVLQNTNLPEVSFTAGPINPDTTGFVANIGNPAFNKVWEVTRAEIIAHQQAIAAGQAGYQVPLAIAEWPALGNTAVAYAPFVDVDLDGRYTPAGGDYPDVPGDQILFFVANDAGQRKVPYSPTMHVEVRGLVYTFDTQGSGSPAEQTIFVRYDVRNQGTTNFRDFYLGHWVDFDLGYYNDDYVGCDRTRQMAYVYNGDSFDDDTLGGYGFTPPAQGVVLLRACFKSTLGLWNASPTRVI